MAQNNPNVHFSSATDLWSTPQALFDTLNDEFHFTLDPCATPENAKCALYYTSEDDGLRQNWDGEQVFMNPPYGRTIKDWVAKAASSDALVVCLLPSRTDTAWWHDYVIAKASDIRYLRGRLKFGDAKNSAPFPSAIVVFAPPSDELCGVCGYAEYRHRRNAFDHRFNKEQS